MLRFSGTVVVLLAGLCGATGRYANAHRHGGFYGVIDRNTYALTVQRTGTLSY